jgi:hypothetical protein
MEGRTVTVEISSDSLAHVTGQILEEAAFIFTEPAETPPPVGQEWIEARMSFSTPDVPDGWLMLAASPSFGQLLAANLLGLEPEDEEASECCKSALAEIINIVGGALVAEWFGEDMSCSLGIPETTTVSLDEHKSSGASVPYSASLVTEEDDFLHLLAHVGRPGGHSK